MIKQFRKGSRVPAVEEFVQDENYYKRIDNNEQRMLYEVTSPSGTKYYEVVEHGHCYKNTQFKSKSIMEGEEMYPMDEDFGKWAWCWNTLERAKQCFNYRRPKSVLVE